MTIIIPYRNRPEHLAQFVPHMRAYLPYVKIVVVEQADDKPFNRGRLINIGYLEAKPDYFVAHDVDMLPIEVDYSPNPGVTQLAGSKIQLRDYLGGVTMFEPTTFEKVGGYHNDYFHRAEDNELRFNLQRLKIPVLEVHGEFKELPHARKTPEFISALWYKAQQPRTIQNQLGICRYEVVERKEYANYEHIKVTL
jgi:beta-1,4-galactosyltransferase 4